MAKLELMSDDTQRWFEACRKVVCSAYFNLEEQVTTFVEMARVCNHPACDAVLNVMDVILFDDRDVLYDHAKLVAGGFVREA